MENFFSALFCIFSVYLRPSTEKRKKWKTFVTGLVRKTMYFSNIQKKFLFSSLSSVIQKCTLVKQYKNLKFLRSYCVQIYPKEVYFYGLKLVFCAKINIKKLSGIYSKWKKCSRQWRHQSFCPILTGNNFLYWNKNNFQTISKRNIFIK